ncbi:MAG: PAS domain-containing sensor histidine kinase [Acidobacteriota bacterium]
MRFGFARCALGLVEALQAGVLVVNSDGTVAYLNEAGATILGVEVDETIHQDVTEILAPLDRLLISGRSKGRWGDRTEVDVVRKDGSHTWIGFKISPVTDMVEPKGTRQYVLLFQDVNDMIKIRQERDRYLRMATMAQILPTIAHEIKNPLAGIKSLADILTEELTDPRHQEDIEAIRTEIERLRMIVDGLGMADGSLMDASTEIDPAEEVRIVLRLVGPKATSLGVELVHEDVGTVLFPLNRSLFRVVLINLLNNALEACTNGDRVSVQCEHNEVGAFRVQVKDTGRGMSAQTLKMATELFFTTKPQGSGIGLALVAQVVKRSNGKILVSSTEGIGTTIDIHLKSKEEG